MKIKHNPTATATLVILNHEAEKEPVLNALFDPIVWDNQNYELIEFDSLDFDHIPNEFWEAIQIADGIAIDHLGAKYCNENVNSGRIFLDYKRFISDLIQNDNYNQCPIFAFVNGLTPPARVIHGFHLGFLMGRLKDKAIEYCIDGYACYSDGNEYFLKQYPMDYKTPARRFLTRMNQYHELYSKAFTVNFEMKEN